MGGGMGWGTPWKETEGLGAGGDGAGRWRLGGGEESGANPVPEDGPKGQGSPRPGRTKPARRGAPPLSLQWLGPRTA